MREIRLDRRRPETAKLLKMQGNAAQPPVSDGLCLVRHASSDPQYRIVNLEAATLKQSPLRQIILRQNRYGRDRDDFTR